MGAFITNYHVRTESQADACEAVAELAQSRAYVSPPSNGWITIYDEISDRQDDRVLAKFGSALSKKLNTTAIACLVHDSDIAMYWLFDRGELLDEFNSAPDYFGKANSKTHARVRGRAEVLLPLCVQGTTLDQVDSILHPPDGPPLMAEDMLRDIGALVGIDADRMSLGFRYFEEEAEETLPDVADFEPVGKGAERKSPKSEAAAPDAPAMPNLFAMAVGMMTHDFEAQLSQMVAGMPAGTIKPDQMLKQLRAQFDRSAREMLQKQAGTLPSYDELKAARDTGPEALAALIDNRAREHLTDIAVCVISMGSKAFLVPLLKLGVDINAKDCRGITPLAAAQHHPEILKMLKTRG